MNRRDEKSLAAVFVVVSAIVAACGGLSRTPSSTAEPADASSSSPPASAAPAAFSCGTLRPNLSVFCVDGTPPHETKLDDGDERPLPEGDAGYVGMKTIPTSMCDLGITKGDPGRRIEADLTVTCEPSAADASALGYDVVLDGYATRRCAPGAYGSGAKAQPYWRGTLHLPGGATYRVSISGTVTMRDLAQSCALSIDGAPAEPLHAGDAVSLYDAAIGEGDHDVVLDCSANDGLVATTCQGYTPGGLASPVEENAHVELAIRAERCAPTGC